MISRSLAFSEAAGNVVGGVDAPFSWRQPPPTEYHAPPNVIQGQPYQHSHHYAEGSAQRGPHNLRMPTVPHPPRNVAPQSYYSTIDQHAQGNSTSQHGVPGSYDQTDPHGIRLRPVSDLRMPSFRRRSRVFMTPLLTADTYRGLFKFGAFNAIQSTCFDTVSLFVAPSISRVLILRQVNALWAKLGKGRT